MPDSRWMRFAWCGCLAALIVAARSPATFGDEATHSQSKEIVVRGEHGATLQTFCVDSAGRIYALVSRPMVYGADQQSRESAGGEVHVLDADGTPVAKWSLDFTPQRIAASPAGEIVVGGDGRLARFAADGKRLTQGEAPHLASVMADKDALRKAAEEQQRTSIESYTRQLKQFEDQIKVLEAQLEKQKATEKPKNSEEQSNAKPAADKSTAEKPAAEKPAAAVSTVRASVTVGAGGGGAVETTTTLVVADEEGGLRFGGGLETQLRMYRQMSASYSRMLDQQKKQTVDDVVRQITLRLQRIHGIAAGKDEIYVATAMNKGYGFAVWRMTSDFRDAEQIITGLSGCCGQIDIQCDGDKLFIAENSRHRVVSFDREGKRLDSWGKRDREGEGAGFGGCCNPMNLTFLADGAILTSESEGFVKRFSKSGEYLGLVGKAKVSGGCKNVAIGATSDGSRIYFYDLAGSKIVVLAATK